MLRKQLDLELLKKAAADPSYNQFQIPKSNGKMRTIMAPNETLKEAQKMLLRVMEERFVPSPNIHAFIKGRSTFSAVRDHIGMDVVVTVDLLNFFPNVKIDMVEEAIEKLILIPLHIESSDIRDMCLAVVFHQSFGLPQGAATSPILSNYVLRESDLFLEKLVYIPMKDEFRTDLNGLNADSDWYIKVRYSRYADDLIFSIPTAIPPEKILSGMIPIIRNLTSPFELNKDKIRIMYKGQRQQVVGLTVNSHATVRRQLKNSLRGYLHTLGCKGESLDKATEGMLSYIRSVDVASYDRLVAIYKNNFQEKMNGNNNEIVSNRSETIPSQGS